MVLKMHILSIVLCLVYFTSSEEEDVGISPLGTVPIGDACTDHSDCVGLLQYSSECTASKQCACLPNFISSGPRDDCLLIVNQLIQPCTESQQCQAGVPGVLSECRLLLPTDTIKHCACKPEAVNAGGEHRCYEKAAFVGDSCEIQAQCVSGTHCSPPPNRKCSCNENFIPADDNKTCLRRKDLGEGCTSQIECTHIENASCRQQNSGTNLVCRCDEGYIPPQGSQSLKQCNKLAEQLGQPCPAYDNQCFGLEDAICVASSGTIKMCECPDTRVPNANNNACLVKIPLNHTCSSTIICTLPNSECIEDKCMCKPEGFVESWLTPGTCVQTISEENRPCSETRQCIHTMGPLSNCRDGICQCNLGYKFNSGKCYYPAALDKLCQTHEECVARVNMYAECSTTQEEPRKCQCMSGAQRFDNACFGSKSIGDACNNDLECRVPLGDNVLCDSGLKTCACRSGYTAEEGPKICISGAERSVTTISIFVVIFGYLMSFL